MKQLNDEDEEAVKTGKSNNSETVKLLNVYIPVWRRFCFFEWSSFEFLQLQTSLCQTSCKIHGELKIQPEQMSGDCFTSVERSKRMKKPFLQSSLPPGAPEAKDLCFSSIDSRSGVTARHAFSSQETIQPVVFFSQDDLVASSEKWELCWNNSSE